MVRILMRLIGAAVVLSLCAPTAALADEQIGLSNDGANWSAELPAPLFDPSFRWVPGDSQTASFYVRNQGPTAGVLTIEARVTDADALLADEHIALRARADNGAWVALENGQPIAGVADQRVDRGGVVKVDVDATFDPASDNASQSKQLQLDFRVNLTDAMDNEPDDEVPVGDDESGRDDDTSSLLPSAGASMPWWVLALGVLTIAGGLALLLRRRRDGGDSS